MASKSIGNRTRFRSAAVLSGLGLAAATMLLTAPSAAADVNSVTVHPGPAGSSAQYGTGCTYEVSAEVTAAGPVDFLVRPAASGTWTKISTVDAAGRGTVKTNWTPNQTGDFVLSAVQARVGKDAPPVTVGNGINLGSSCIAV